MISEAGNGKTEFRFEGTRPSPAPGRRVKTCLLFCRTLIISEMNQKLDHAPDLTKRPPRSPRVRLGGFVVLARILDKGRAELAGTAGEFKYNNPGDYHWFRFTGITPEALKAELATGKGDGEMLSLDSGERA